MDENGDGMRMMRMNTQENNETDGDDEEESEGVML